MFCRCGKLMTLTETGYECLCGLKKDTFGNDISEEQALSAENEAKKVALIKSKYHSKYPNINDPVVRVTQPEPEDETTDETMSALTPKQRSKRRGR